MYLTDLYRLCGNQAGEAEGYRMHDSFSQSLLKDHFQSSQLAEHKLIQVRSNVYSLHHKRHHYYSHSKRSFGPQLTGRLNKLCKKALPYHLLTYLQWKYLCFQWTEGPCPANYVAGIGSLGC